MYAVLYHTVELEIGSDRVDKSKLHGWVPAFDHRSPGRMPK